MLSDVFWSVLGPLVLVIFLGILYVVANRVLSPAQLFSLSKFIENTYMKSLLKRLNIYDFINSRLSDIDLPPEEVYRQAWGFDEGDDIYIVMPELDDAVTDGGNREPIDVTTLSFPTDRLTQGETYNFTITPEEIVSGCNNGRCYKQLIFNDIYGNRNNIYISEDKENLYRYEFDEERSYVVTNVVFNVKIVDGKTYYNLRATQESVIRIGSQMVSPEDEVPLNEVSLGADEYEPGYGYDIRITPHTVRRQSNRRELIYQDADGERRMMTIWRDTNEKLYNMEYSEGETYLFNDVKYQIKIDTQNTYHNILLTKDSELVTRQESDVALTRDRYPMFRAVVHVYGGLISIYEDINVSVMTDSEFDLIEGAENGTVIFIGTSETLAKMNVDHTLQFDDRGGQPVLRIDTQRYRDDIRPRDPHGETDIVDGGGISKTRNPENRVNDQFVITGTSNKGVTGAAKALLPSNPGTEDESLDNCRYLLDQVDYDNIVEENRILFDTVFDVKTRRRNPEIPTLEREPVDSTVDTGESS